MRKFFRVFSAILLLIAAFLPTGKVFASSGETYFSDFTADYYLSKQSDGSSEMKVREKLSAVFPSYNQNHGIERKIPFLNQDDTNLTMESTTALDIKVTRNGRSEPYTIKTYDNYFLVRIGNPDTYVHDKQEYILEYKFINVITEFDLSGYASEAYQELYWDSNGNGWSQRFDSLTVNLHMDNSILKSVKSDRTFSKSPTYKNKSVIHENNETKEKLAAWCYVGTYGANGQDRCKITDLSDGISFSAKNLKARENLTFVVNFNDKTFEIPKNNYVKELSYKDFTVDYYLSKDENNQAILKVKENITVLFPTKNEEYGITRYIPFANRNNTNFITENQEHLTATVKMDGKAIEYSSTPSSIDGYFRLSTGSYDEYLHGEHNFEIEYTLKNVMELINDTKTQYLYLAPTYMATADKTSITYTLHLDNNLKNELKEIEYDDTNSPVACVAVSQTEANSTSGCSYKIDGDTVTFSATNLTKKDALHAYIYFKEGTFNLPEPNRNYVYWHIFLVVAIFVTILFLVFYHRTFKKVGDKIKYFRRLPVVPEYTPHKDLTVGQAAKVYLGKTKNPRVATMLELIVNKKISLKKGRKKTFGGYEWSGEVKNLSNISNEQRDLLKILNGGENLDHIGDTFEIRTRSYSSSLESAHLNYDTHIEHHLKTNDYFEEKTKNSKSDTYSFFKSLGKIFALLIALYLSIFVIFAVVALYLEVTDFTKYSVYEGKWTFPISIGLLFITFLSLPIFSMYAAKYKERTEKGLEASRYLDGLKRYIKMAEADRLKFLQSVENVDTSEEGIVKLNEKLLPYAALFGLEKSWMKELEKYYNLHEEKSPDWYAAGFSYSLISSTMRSATSRPIDTSSSSGSSRSSGGGSSSSSSSSSGGGGGGFSGGGGGGGGGGVW